MSKRVNNFKGRKPRSKNAQFLREQARSIPGVGFKNDRRGCSKKRLAVARGYEKLMRM